MLNLLLFFTHSISSIHSHYERLFKGTDEEGEETETRNPTSGNPLQQYGILPFIIKVCEVTNTDFESVLGWSICQVFTIICYAIDKQKLEELQIKQWKATH